MPPTFIGASDASKEGMGGFWAPTTLHPDATPILWKAPFPGTVRNATDNTPALAWSTKGSTSATTAPAFLLCQIAQSACHLALNIHPLSPQATLMQLLISARVPFTCLTWTSFSWLINIFPPSPHKKWSRRRIAHYSGGCSPGGYAWLRTSHWQHLATLVRLLQWTQPIRAPQHRLPNPTPSRVCSPIPNWQNCSQGRSGALSNSGRSASSRWADGRCTGLPRPLASQLRTIGHTPTMPTPSLQKTGPATHACQTHTPANNSTRRSPVLCTQHPSNQRGRGYAHCGVFLPIAPRQIRLYGQPRLQPLPIMWYTSRPQHTSHKSVHGGWPTIVHCHIGCIGIYQPEKWSPRWTGWAVQVRPPTLVPCPCYHQQSATLMVAWCSAPTSLYTYKDWNSWYHVKTSLLTRHMRHAASAIGASSGIKDSDISVRSLRMSGAMALLCARVGPNVIRLLGIWRSDEMLRYACRNSGHV